MFGDSKNNQHRDTIASSLTSKKQEEAPFWGIFLTEESFVPDNPFISRYIQCFSGSKLDVISATRITDVKWPWNMIQWIT